VITGVGLQCGKVDPALRAQLGLGEGKGVLVEEVVKESQALKRALRSMTC